MLQTRPLARNAVMKRRPAFHLLQKRVDADAALELRAEGPLQLEQ